MPLFFDFYTITGGYGIRPYDKKFVGGHSICPRNYFFIKLAHRRLAQQNRLTIQYWLQNMGADTRFSRSFKKLPKLLEAATANTLAQKTITVRLKEQMATIRTRRIIFLFFSFVPITKRLTPGIKKIREVNTNSTVPMPSTFSTVPNPTHRIYRQNQMAYATISFSLEFIGSLLGIFSLFYRTNWNFATENRYT